MIGDGAPEIPPPFARLSPARQAWQDAGTLHLIYGAGDGAVQVRMRWRAALGPTSVSVELPMNDRSFGQGSHAFARLARLHATGRLDNLQADPRSRRLHLILQALDGAIAGMSHREIAVTLFGPERVQADWRHPGQHLRDRVRRAVSRGHFLMEGGYRALLR